MCFLGLYLKVSKKLITRRILVEEERVKKKFIENEREERRAMRKLIFPRPNIWLNRLAPFAYRLSFIVRRKPKLKTNVK